MIAVRLPSHFPVRATEWMLAFIKALWGLLLLAAPGMFDAPATEQIMRGLSSIAPQPVWGWIGAIAGTAHLSALWVNGTRRRSPHLRAACSFVGVLFWWQVTVGVLGGPISTGWAVYPVFTVFSIYNVVRAMRDARLSDDRARASEGLIGGRS